MRLMNNVTTSGEILGDTTYPAALKDLQDIRGYKQLYFHLTFNIGNNFNITWKKSWRKYFWN